MKSHLVLFLIVLTSSVFVMADAFAMSEEFKAQVREKITVLLEESFDSFLDYEEVSDIYEQTIRAMENSEANEIDSLQMEQDFHSFLSLLTEAYEAIHSSVFSMRLRDYKGASHEWIDVLLKIKNSSRVKVFESTMKWLPPVGFALGALYAGINLSIRNLTGFDLGFVASVGGLSAIAYGCKILNFEKLREMVIPPSLVLELQEATQNLARAHFQLEPSWLPDEIFEKILVVISDQPFSLPDNKQPLLSVVRSQARLPSIAEVPMRIVRSKAPSQESSQIVLMYTEFP